MFKVFKSFRDVPFHDLMMVYQQSLQENGNEFYPDLPKEVQIIEAEQDFYVYLKSFFKEKGALYFVWEDNDQFISALRLEPYNDGFLLEALETAPDYRKQGYASMLFNAVLEYAKENQIQRIYSHIHRNNEPSIMLHKKFGFQCIANQATYIDGSVSHHSHTFLLQL